MYFQYQMCSHLIVNFTEFYYPVAVNCVTFFKYSHVIYAEIKYTLLLQIYTMFKEKK